jgi:hypothetical protein
VNTDQNGIEYNLYVYMSNECRQMSNVSRLMSIHKNANHQTVVDAVKQAYKLGITDNELFNNNPHIWKNGEYIAFCGPLLVEC